MRYVQGHGVDAGTLWVLAGGAVLVALYAVVVVAVGRGSSRAPGWALLLVATWVPLNLLAPSFSWLRRRAGVRRAADAAVPLGRAG